MGPYFGVVAIEAAADCAEGAYSLYMSRINRINISSGEDAFIEYEVEQKEEEVEDALT